MCGSEQRPQGSCSTVVTLKPLDIINEGDLIPGYANTAANAMSAAPGTPLFGTVERRLFRATAVLAAMVALACLAIGIVWVLGIVLSFFYSLVLPLSVAGIFALVLYPVVDWLARPNWLPRSAAAIIVVLVFMVALAAGFILVVPALISELVLFAEIVPSIISRWQAYMVENFPSFTQLVMKSTEDGDIKDVMPGLKTTQRTITSFAGILAGLSFVPLLMFFALLSGRHLHATITNTLSVFSDKTQRNTMYFVDVFLAQVTGFFQGQLVIAVIMGVMYALGFTLIDLKGGILIGLLLGLLNIVPFLGTLIGLLIVLPLAYTQPYGGLGLLLLSLLVFSVVQLVESWLLTPKIMENRSGLHPVLVVISVFFWGMAFGGITGMILAVPLTAFIVAVWKQTKASLTQSMRSDDDEGRIEIAGSTSRPSSVRDAHSQRTNPTQ